jgi:hypothetical protein
MIMQAGKQPTAVSLEDVFCYHVDASFVRAFLRPEQKFEANQGVANDIRLLPERVVFEILGMKVPESKVYFLTLVPLAHSAWAQSTPNSLQINRIMAKSVRLGIRDGSPAHNLLRSWLHARPESRLYEMW